MTYNTKDTRQDVIGLIPAAGSATRLRKLPCSKEIYPVGYRKIDEQGKVQPKAVSLYLLEKMRLAGVTRTYIILRENKWDIPAYLGDGTMVNMHIAYLMMGLPFGVPYTLDQAFPFTNKAIIVFGFPDILFQSEDAFTRLLNRQAETNADIVLGLFPIDRHQKWDMVDLSDDGRIRRIDIKPSETSLRYGWVIAVWTPVFTHYMHEYLSSLQKAKKTGDALNNPSDDRELFVGDIIQAAIDDNLQVEGVLFHDNSCLDIGTPDDLLNACRGAL